MSKKMTALSVPYPETYEQWLEIRRHGIGGSDVAAVLGLNPWRTPVQVWQDKTGQGEKQPESPSMYWGKQLEDLVAKEFQRRMGMKVQRVNRVIREGENGWMVANIDRAIVNPAIRGNVRVLDDETKIQENEGRRITTDAILECKTAHSFTSQEWGDTQEYEILKKELVTEHKIPVFYETQVQWYMAITGVAVCYLAVLIGGNDFRVYLIRRNDEVINVLKEKCWEFWLNCVLANKAPEPVNIDDVKRLFKIDSGEMTEASNDIAADIGELLILKDKVKSLEEQQGALSLRITEALGEKLGFTIGGEKAVTFKTQTTRRFDSASFKKDQPALYEKYVKVSTNRILKTY